MNEILKPARFVQALFLLLIAVSVFHFSACQPAAPGGEAINQDSVKRHIISIDSAIRYTTSFRASIDSFNKNAPHFADSMRFGHAEAFNKDIIRELLLQSNGKQGPAAGIRIYFGRDNTGLIRMVLVPYDTAGNDIINHIMDLNGKPITGAHVEALTVSGGQAGEDGIRCPTLCGDGSSGL
jgi:hypothetical protein